MKLGRVGIIRKDVVLWKVCGEKRYVWKRDTFMLRMRALPLDPFVSVKKELVEWYCRMSIMLNKKLTAFHHCQQVVLHIYLVENPAMM